MPRSRAQRGSLSSALTPRTDSHLAAGQFTQRLGSVATSTRVRAYAARCQRRWLYLRPCPRLCQHRWRLSSKGRGNTELVPLTSSLAMAAVPPAPLPALAAVLPAPLLALRAPLASSIRSLIENPHLVMPWALLQELASGCRLDRWVNSLQVCCRVMALRPSCHCAAPACNFYRV